MGRPPAAGAARDARIFVRVLLEEHERWSAAAERAGLSLSEWLRRLANSATTGKR